MININIDSTIDTPIYEQIKAQIKLCVANHQIKPGESMPIIQQLSCDLQIGKATIARAYQQLKREGILDVRRRRGTIVTCVHENSRSPSWRQSRLIVKVDNLLQESFKQGYQPDELATSFTEQMARWRLQRKEFESTMNEDLMDKREISLTKK
jgi:GntR family transcriptional regulator